MAEAALKPQRGNGLFRTIALAGALALGACSSIIPRGAPETAPPPQQPTRPVETTEPQVSQGIPQDEQRHRVALLVPTSGNNAGVGQSIANATQMALLDTKSERVRITTYDTATGAADAARRAIADGNGLILGPLLSEDVRAVAPIAAAAHVPVLSFSNDTSVAGNGAFILGYTPAQSIERVVSFAAQNGMTQFAALVPSGLYGERASDALLRAVRRQNGDVVSIQTYDRSRASIDAAVKRIPETSPYQAILIADSAGTAAVAVPTIRATTGASAKVLGTELWNTDSAVADNKVLNGAWFASVPDGLYRQYAEKYRARFGKAPYRLSTIGYDVVLLTVRIARDWKVGQRFPMNDLMSDDGFAGLDGAFRFDNSGVAQRALEVQAIRNGQTVTVSVAPKSFE
ncbi:penicillin-binding protein activator [Stakelama sp. CBK3Z-3]|uniref:Penicillin-binding protein activator n=1 Tax=Stakelama flava TaxID=2860338 RepID=A0ABS6XNE4_9SPHN|nr:penicillin-binding protein activator [Stakelama flava]MBW4331706.1 penicillin-binding protein activator [Stakelama flava]